MKTRTRAAKRNQQGMALILTLFFLFIICMLAVTMLTASMAANRLAERSGQKLQATAMAEAAVHAHYDAIKAAMAKDGNYPLAIAPTALNGLVSGTTTVDGTYASRIVGTPEKLDLDLLDTNNLKVGLKLFYTFVLEGEGTSSDGKTTSRVRATFNVTQLRAFVQAAPAPAFAANAPVQSNTNIEMVTDGGLRITSSSGNNASIIANDGVAWKTSTVDKSTIRSSSAIRVDGQIRVPRSPDPAYTSTVGPDGMGNPNGSINYQTLSATSSNGQPAAAANSIATMNGEQSFASEAQVATWKADWNSKASGGTRYSGTVTPSTIAPNLLGERRITAPAYIDGDLLVNSGQIYLQPNTDKNKPNVIYVTGNISNAGKIYNRGVVLVCAGRYSDSGTSALYSLQTQFSLFTSQSAVYSAAALVALGKSADAIALNTSSTGPAGLVYAALGGIRVKGNTEMRGVLVAGGSGATGGMRLTPSSGSFTLRYEPDALDRDDFPMNPGDIHVGAVVGLDPTRLKNWIQVK